VTLGIGIVQINVTDLDEAWRFYVERLGFRGKRIFGPGKAFAIEPGRPGPTILVYSVARLVNRDYPRETGVTIVFFTEDLQSTIRDWRLKDVCFVPIEWARDETGVGDSPFGRFIGFRDPFGNVHELMEPRRPL